VVVVVVAMLAIAMYLLGLLSAFKIAAPGAPITRHLIYSAATANDATIALPDSVKSDLRSVGLLHEQIMLTRVDSTGETQTSVIDLTPRTSDDPNAPALKVQDRATQAIDVKITAIETAMNSSQATSGNRALFVGLTKSTFTAAPVTIFSSGLDLTAPDDFRQLNWDVAPDQVVRTVKQAGELPDLAEAPVTFVIIAASGTQQQLRQAQKDYRKAVWTALLTSSRASSVAFVDGTGSASRSTTVAPPVPLPQLPGTPVRPIVDTHDPKRTLCSLPSSTYFQMGRAVLADKAKTIKDLQPCVSAALAAKANLELDGWTSYEGPLAPDGRPSTDLPENRRLSAARVAAIADLLTTDMQVPKSKITHLEGHGNMAQPNPNPRDPGNRLVIVSYVTT